MASSCTSDAASPNAQPSGQFVEAPVEVLREIVRRYGTPTYAYDISRIRAQVAKLRTHFPAAVEILYSLKANASLGLCGVLAECGLGADVASSCIGPRDERHCKTCGGVPQLSYFAVASEDLAAGGRFLLCSRCHSTWSYARMTCPGCGEDSSSRLPIFNEEGNASGERGSVVRGLEGRLGDHRKESTAVFPHIRIEACESCRGYLLNIDLLADPDAVPIVDEIAALPLDLYAGERGFSKITPNLMGF